VIDLRAFRTAIQNIPTDKVADNLISDKNTMVSDLNAESIITDNKTWVSSFTLPPSGKQECKILKIEHIKILPGVFPDMLTVKYNRYTMSISKFKPFSFDTFKYIPDIYMLTNKITKKYYIGMSTNLKIRLESYFNEKRLNNNRSLIIHKALLKYGLYKFSLSILELDINRSNTNDSF